jgi:hypothetical protein
MKVVHTDEALDNLDGILAYIASNYPTISAAFERRLRQRPKLHQLGVVHAKKCEIARWQHRSPTADIRAYRVLFWSTNCAALSARSQIMETIHYGPA